MARLALLSLLLLAGLAGACDGGMPGTQAPATASPSPSTPPAAPSPASIDASPTFTPGVDAGCAQLAVRYTYYNYFCGAGFPALLVYEDGTVLSSGPVRCEGWPPSPTSGQRYAIGTDGVAPILAELRARGLFELDGADLSGSQSPTDPMCFTVEAYDGPDHGSAHGYRPVAPLDGIVAYLDTVIAGLRGGVPYEPAAFLLAARKVKRGEARGDVRVWPLPIDVRQVSSRAVPPQEVRLLQEVAGDHGLYGRVYVRSTDGTLYAVTWRPLFPHEQP